MSEQITIHSRLRDYKVELVGNVFPILATDLDCSSCLMVDRTVYELFAEELQEILKEHTHLIVEATEPHKSYDYCGEIIRQLLDMNVRKNTKIIALGGGIIQDIAAFCSSIMFRGIEWAFVPTTLLAQADSCIGGKTSINFGPVKNKLGNFYPPSVIYIDTGFLNTLSVDDIKSGIGEILHFYYYADSTLISQLYDNYPTLLNDGSQLKPHILESIRIKKSVIEIDEFDRGERNKFNYGHTFGHALESVTNYAIKHGEAVTIGMDIANMLSTAMGLMEERTYKSIRSKLEMNFPEYRLSGIDVTSYLGFLAKDKKNVDEQLTCILSEGPGRLLKTKIPMDAKFRERIASYFSQY